MESSSPQILDTEFSVYWLEKTLQNYLENHSGSNITAWNCQKIGETQGYLSDLIQVSLKWSESTPEKFPKSVILKIPVTKWGQDTAAGAVTQSEDVQTFLIKAHQLECNFYELWGKETAPFKVPRCFSTRLMGATNEPGYLLMEDLSTLGMVPDSTQVLTLPQCLSIMENFAKLHAWCFETRTDFESALPLPPRETTKSLIDLIRGLLIDLKSRWADFFQDRIDILLDRYFSVNDWHYAHDMYKNFGMQPVICHGDFWITNVFFAKEKDGSVGTTVTSIIDWQFAHTGTLTEDLACILYACLDPEMRRRDLNIILDHYYHSLIANLSSGVPPFSFEKLLEAYHCLEKYGLLFQFSMVATVGTNEHHINTKPEGLLKVLERGRDNLDDFLKGQN